MFLLKYWTLFCQNRCCWWPTKSVDPPHMPTIVGIIYIFTKKNSKYIHPKKTCLLTLATLQTKSLWTKALDLGTTYDILMLHAIYLNSKKNCYLYKFENDILHCLVLSLAWYGLQFCPWSLIVILQRQKMRKKCGKSMIPQQRGEMTCNWKLSSPESSFCLLAACECV